MISSTLHAAQRETIPGGSTPVIDQTPLALPQNATCEVIDIAGQPFKTALRVTTEKVDGEQWVVGTGTKTTVAIAKGDTLYADFAVRCRESMTGDAAFTFLFEEGPPTHTKSVQFPVTAGKDWTYIKVPFQAHRDFAAGEANVRFWFGYPNQSIEIADLRVVNYGKEVDYKTLPRTRLNYKGREPDASWRKEADARIDRLRKADLTVQVLDSTGQPRANASVQIKMTRHAFAFGTCVAVKAIESEAADADRYRAELVKLFNQIVFENDLKAPGIHNGSLDRVERDLSWLEKNQITARGHVLVWPAWRWNKHLEPLKDKPDELRQAIRDHITSTVTRLKGRLVDWDVMNEPFSNHDFMDILGNAEMVEWFKLAKAADPACNTYINDYGVLEGGPNHNQHLQHYFKTIQYLIDNGAPFDGIGFQGHVGSNLVSPNDLLKVLDQFSVFGKRFKITELDINLNNDETLRADYMRDFLTVCFSHDRVDGVLQWGFWSGRHWLPQTALFDKDWNLRPHGQAYLDLVFKTWWTDEARTTGTDGKIQLRGFKGDYDIVVDGKTTHAVLDHDGVTVLIK